VKARSRKLNLFGTNYKLASEPRECDSLHENRHWVLNEDIFLNCSQASSSFSFRRGPKRINGELVSN